MFTRVYAPALDLCVWAEYYARMAEVKSARLTRPQLDAIEEMVDEGRADNASEALRVAVDSGLVEMGYRGAAASDTDDTYPGVRAAARRFRDAFVLLGVMWLGVSFWLPLELRIYATGPFAAAVACDGIERSINRWGHRVGSDNRGRAAVADGGEQQ